MPTTAFNFCAPECFTTVDANGRLVDRRVPISFDASNLPASHVNTVHLVARRANGEQLGGSGIEIIFEGVRFVLTSAKNMGEFNLSAKEVDPYEEMVGFKKRKGNEHGEKLVLS